MPKRESTPTYVLTLPLKVEIWQEHILEKRLNIGRTLYNDYLGEAKRRYNQMKNSPEYRKARELEKGKERDKAFKEVRKLYQLDGSYCLNTYAKTAQKVFKQNIGMHMAQNLAERAFSAIEKVMFGKAKRVNFVPKGEAISLEEKTNKTGFRYDTEKNCMTWGKNSGLELPVLIKKNDEYAHIALLDTVKYCRLVKKNIRGKNRYFVQFALEGTPPKKRNKKISEDETARVGLDIGTSSLAVTSEKEVRLVELSEGISIDEKKKRVLQRKVDRSRRANNPNKFNEDGTIKKGNREKWVQSQNYLKLKRELAEMNRKIADKRKQAHFSLANHILSLGLDVRVETMRFQSLQKRAKKTEKSEKTGRFKKKKRFGKSIGNRAPAMLLTILDNKLKAQGLYLKKINTYTVKASQFEHFTQTYNRKKLNTRWNNFESGQIQRDMYSAFLIMNTQDNLEEIDTERCNQTWNRFQELHDREIQRLRQLNKPQLSSMGL